MKRLVKNASNVFSDYFIDEIIEGMSTYDKYLKLHSAQLETRDDPGEPEWLELTLSAAYNGILTEDQKANLTELETNQYFLDQFSSMLASIASKELDKEVIIEATDIEVKAKIEDTRLVIDVEYINN